VLSRPPDVTDGALAAALAEGWGIDAAGLEYLAVGFGSHHWLAADGDARWFVTVDDLDARRRTADEPRDDVAGRLTAALRTARALRDSGLGFVVAPLVDRHGTVVRRLADRYTLATYPWIDGTAGRFGDVEAPADRHAVLDLVVALHAAPRPAGLDLPADDLAIWRRADLLAALDDLHRPWRSGPLGDVARAALDTHAASVDAMLARYDDLAAGVLARRDRFVVTHGEPHPGNTMRTAAGWLLIDWDTTLLAPPERDLWTVAGSSDEGVLAAYTAATGTTVDRDALECYRLGWDVTDIALYVALLREPHEDTADVRASFAGLAGYLERAGT
jgi:hypothetical protein